MDTSSSSKLNQERVTTCCDYEPSERSVKPDESGYVCGSPLYSLANDYDSRESKGEKLIKRMLFVTSQNLHANKNLDPLVVGYHL